MTGEGLLLSPQFPHTTSFLQELHIRNRIKTINVRKMEVRTIAMFKVLVTILNFPIVNPKA